MRLTFFLVLITMATARAQNYIPLTVAGYNNDVVADTGTDATLVTTTDLDLSNNILYSAAFAATNSLTGGMHDNGTVSTATRTYQLASYNGNNGLYLSKNGLAPHSAASGVFTLATPAMFSKLSLLVFSTEGNSTVDVLLRFTDGTVVTVATYDVLDWFDGSNAVYQSFGRIDRVTGPPFNVDGIPGVNPQFYPLDINVPCAHQSKMVQSVTLSFASGTTAACRVVALALSGISFTPMNITPVLSPATCGKNNGSIDLTVSGGVPPFTYLWSTNPNQTTPLADSLLAGNYTCRVLDSNGCATIYRGTVTQTSGLDITASASTPEICLGEQVQLKVVVNGGTASTYTWTPGNINGANATVSPTGTTVYTVNVKDDAGALPALQCR